MVVMAQATQNHPSMPAVAVVDGAVEHRRPCPSGSAARPRPRTATATPVQRTSSSSGPRARPGCTRYQWPSSIASVTAPRNAAPTSTRATDNQAGIARVDAGRGTRPTRPMAGATRSSTGRELGTPSCRTSARRGRCRSSPRRGRTAPTCSRWPATPALRRTTYDEGRRSPAPPRAAAVAPGHRTEPGHHDEAASRPKEPRISQP